MQLINITLLLLITTSAITDVKERKIYNTQTYSAMALGLIIHFFCYGINGFLFSLCGLGIGTLLLIFFYFIGGIGAGDVKLLAAIGALKGSSYAIETMFYAALIGGCMALMIIIRQRTFTQTLKNSVQYICHPISYSQDDSINHQYLPYGVAISLGCAFTYVISYMKSF